MSSDLTVLQNTGLEKLLGTHDGESKAEGFRKLHNVVHASYPHQMFYELKECGLAGPCGKYGRDKECV